MLPEREDTNHEDTLLTLLLNKKLAWRRPENIGKQRGMGDLCSIRLFAPMQGACSSAASQIAAAHKVGAPTVVPTRGSSQLFSTVDILGLLLPSGVKLPIRHALRHSALG